MKGLKISFFRPIFQFSVGLETILGRKNRKKKNRRKITDFSEKFDIFPKKPIFPKISDFFFDSKNIKKLLQMSENDTLQPPSH